MLDWHSCQICYPLEIKMLLLLLYVRILALPFRPLYNNMSLLSFLRFLRDSHFKRSGMPVMVPVSKL